MANGTSKVNLSIPLSTFLATVEGDGTIADVIQTAKVDRVGYEVNASGISTAAGQRWANLVDDFALSYYEMNQGRENDSTLSTVGATTDEKTVATLSTNGDLWRMKAIVTARTTTDGEVASARLEGHFYRDAGTVTILDNIHTVVATSALAGVDADWDISSDDVRIQVTGIAAKTIAWHIRVEYAEQIS